MGRIVGLTFPASAGEATARDAEDAYICPHCGKEYKSKVSLSKHIKDKHPEATEGAPEEE